MSDKQQNLGSDFEPNWKSYRQASEPHASPAAAEKASKEFMEELSELRLKHRIKDLLIIYTTGMIEDDGLETCGMHISGFGTQTLWESMAACAYGSEKALREKRIRELLSCSED